MGARIRGKHDNIYNQTNERRNFYTRYGMIQEASMRLVAYINVLEQIVYRRQGYA